MSTVTPAEMLANTEMALRRANVALAVALDCLVGSSWDALGAVLTDEEVARRDALRKAVNEAKSAVERGLHG